MKLSKVFDAVIAQKSHVRITRQSILKRIHFYYPRISVQYWGRGTALDDQVGVLLHTRWKRGILKRAERGSGCNGHEYRKAS